MARKTVYPLTLIEVFVACALFSLISYYLFASFKSASLLVKRLECGKSHVLQQQYLHQRLLPLFAKTTAATYVDEESADHPFLLFAFDNGVDIDPDFCGPVHGRLYINEAQNLLLEIAPQQAAQKAPRKEVLETQIASIEWDTHIARLLGLHILYQDQRESHFGFFLESDKTPLFTFSEAL